MMRITIVGTGYVGLSLSTLLSVYNEVIAYDINQEKVQLINKRISPIKDEYIEKYFKEKKLNLTATTNKIDAYKNSSFIIICTPTDYDPETNYFNTKSVESVIEDALKINDNNPCIIIKSTIPVGFTESMREKYKYKNIIFSPEFLREGNALYDNLYPSRIIVGDKSPSAHEFAELLKRSALKEHIDVKYMNSTEAEAVKLFSNTYLALRVAYFNELDTYAELKGLNTKDIIDGVCLDPRISSSYNNPSFGYGGYCLPKDTKQLLANYVNVPQDIITAIVNSNQTRKKHIKDMILSRNPKTVGIYRLTMKSGSDNFRCSAVKDIIDMLEKENVNIIIYEPTINEEKFGKHNIIKDLNKFKSISDIIVANRYSNELEDIKEKLYTRDIFEVD